MFLEIFFINLKIRKQNPPVLKTIYPCAFAAFFFSVFLVPVFGQSLRYAMSMPYIRLGAFSNKPQEPFGFTANQAALARMDKGSLGCFGERRFLLSENSVFALAAAIPSKQGNFGVELNHAGFKNFNENKIGLAYAKKLSKLLDLGIQFNYYSCQVPQYGNAASLHVEIGAIAHFSENFCGGIHAYNPVGGFLGKGKSEKLASAYSFGLGYDASEFCNVSASIIKEEDKPVNVIAGVQYQFEKQFFAKVGCMSESSSFFAGFGLGWRNLRLDLSGSFHPQLGFSPGVLLILQFKKAK